MRSGLLPPAGPRLRLLRVTCLIALGRGDFAAAADALRDARAESPVSGESFGTFETLMLTEPEVGLLAAQGDPAAALAAARLVLAGRGQPHLAVGALAVASPGHHGAGGLPGHGAWRPG